jgi:NAD+ kinase
MSEQSESPHALLSARRGARRLGIVVHPSRDIAEPLNALFEWTGEHGVEVVQVRCGVAQRDVAVSGDPADCQLIVSIGGDGTTLAAIRCGAEADRPVLGVAYGSLGVLTAVQAGELPRALERFEAGDWRAVRLPALEATRPRGPHVRAFNDLAIVRSAEGQARVAASLDGELFARFAGDGCVVSTPVGSSGYTLGARGPLVAPGTAAFVLTPLPYHGGFCPPLVMPAAATLELHPTAGHGGARLELDGQVADTEVGPLTIRLRPDVATLVSFEGQESTLAGLRRRRLIIDAPRILAEELRG